jgi:PhzF family phenazine biosynthesis protein
VRLRQFQADAFAARVFEGNPAAIVPLAAWLPDATMQKIALENNLAETAFFVETAPGRYHLRWFTPEIEVDLCGHATLASAFVVFRHLAPKLDAVVFDTRSGPLTVTKTGNGAMTMDFPALESRALDNPGDMKARIAGAMGSPEPAEVFAAPDLMAVYADAAAVRALSTRNSLAALLTETGMRGLIATAPSDDPAFDFVSRFFAPNHGIPEDPVTGSAHCKLAPYWAARLGKTHLVARQISPRGGTVICELRGDRVTLTGTCAPFMEAVIEVPD